MGRYYEGDIDGKFMFAVQSSNSADRFGSEGFNNYLEYYFEERHLEAISEQLFILKPAWEKVEEFLKDKGYWNDKEQKEAGISEEEMSEYADYCLGIKIFNCVKDNGECNFTAEI